MPDVINAVTAARPFLFLDSCTFLIPDYQIAGTSRPPGHCVCSSVRSSVPRRASFQTFGREFVAPHPAGAFFFAHPKRRTLAAVFLIDYGMWLLSLLDTQ